MKLASIIMTLRTKGQSMEYRHKESPQTKKNNQNTDLGWKGHFYCFWNSERVVLADFLEKETTINSQRYIETLTVLKRRIERIGKRNETLLQHDNARPHTSAVTRDEIQCLDFQYCRVDHIAQIWPQVISTCSQN